MADEQPESGADQPQAEGAEAAEEIVAPPPPHPLVTALQAQFPSGFEVEDEDAGGNPIVRVGVDSLIAILTWLRDDESTKFDYLADQTVTDWTERSPRFERKFIVHQDQYRRFTPAELDEMYLPFGMSSFERREHPNGAQNVVQFNYIRKFTAEFSREMTRSVRLMLKEWRGEEA